MRLYRDSSQTHETSGRVKINIIDALSTCRMLMFRGGGRVVMDTCFSRPDGTIVYNDSTVTAASMMSM